MANLILSLTDTKMSTMDRSWWIWYASSHNLLFYLQHEDIDNSRDSTIIVVTHPAGVWLVTKSGGLKLPILRMIPRSRIAKFLTWEYNSFVILWSRLQKWLTTINQFCRTQSHQSGYWPLGGSGVEWQKAMFEAFKNRNLCRSDRYIRHLNLLASPRHY